MISVLAGPNRFALQNSLQKARADFIENHGDLAIESFDAEEVELEEIRGALAGISLFTPTKMVVVKSLSGNKEAAESIDDILDSTPEETELLIVEPKPDKRSTYFKTLAKKAKVTEFGELDEVSLASWLVNEAKKAGASLARAEAQYLIARTGVNQAKVYTELRKLIDYDPNITRQSIDLLVVSDPQDKVFDLLDAAFSGAMAKTGAIYDNLRINGSQPPVILSMIVWQMHQVALIASAGQRSIDEVAGDSGAKAYPLQKAHRIANNLGVSKIKSILVELEDLDYRSKTETIDIDAALKNLLSKIATS